MKLSGAPFTEVMVALSGESQPNPANRSFSPTARVPCLHDGATIVWDSLAIARVPRRAASGDVAGRSAPPARGRGRCARRCTRVSRSLRNEMTMCIRERVDVRPWSPGLQRDIARVDGDLERRPAASRAGGILSLRRLFAGRCVLRAGRVPLSHVRRRAATERRGAYLAALLAHPFLREWEAAALKETAIIDADEPRIIYRDKLAAKGGGTHEHRRRSPARGASPRIASADACARIDARAAGGGRRIAAQARIRARRHQGSSSSAAAARISARGRCARHDALCGHRRLRPDRARDHGARRARGSPTSNEAMRDCGPDARLRAAALRRRARRSAAWSQRDCRGRAVPTPARSATSSSACACSTARARTSRSAAAS